MSVPEYTGLEYFKLAVFYASYLYFPAAALLIWAIARRRIFRWACVIAFCGLSVLVCSFIRPRILLTVEHDIQLKRCFASAGEVQLLVFSDTHQGLFGNISAVDGAHRRRVNASGAGRCSSPATSLPCCTRKSSTRRSPPWAI
ncbi:MAG: hypothetical protein R3C55_08150 [Parvularculaceae bacterium]